MSLPPRSGLKRNDTPDIRSGAWIPESLARGLVDVYELLGRNLAGEYLHIVYRVLADGRLRVFHMNRMMAAQQRRYRRIRR